ncbi:MAG: serine/threonine protein kinase [Deltaproteobacteria bacterium]|nr:serine/threonine protein kinase [Deltaproteobacteria bacterium]
MAPAPEAPPAARTSSTPSTSHHERLALQRAARLALGAWPSFVALDLYMALVLFPASRLGLLLFYRALGEVVNLAAFAIIRRPRASLRQARIAHGAMYFAMGLLISLMSLELGGLGSRYVHGVSIVVMVRAIVVPARARVSLAWSLPIMLVFPIVHAVAGHGFGVSESAFTTHRLELFVSDYVFLVGSTVVGTASGHLIWSAEQQLYRARKLGRYRLEAPIARGGMGEIWLATDESLKRQVALKILRSGVAMDETAVARFEREAQAASNLTSPHTIKIFDYGAADDGIRFIAMEHLDGADLGAIVERHGPMPVARVLQFARQACRSLAEAHAAGIVHRDIKPQNLFATRVGSTFDFLKLLDFGIARFAESESRTSLTRTGAIPGTPAYIAPELWAGGRADVRSDVYALGATLFFLLSATTFSEHDLASEGGVLRVRDSRGEPVGDALEAVIARCVAAKPSERFATIQELEDALAACEPPDTWTAEDARTFWLVEHPEAATRWQAQTAA